MQVRWRAAGAGVLPLAVVLLVAGPAGWLPISTWTPPGSATGTVIPFGLGVGTSLSLGLSVGRHLASPFWGVNTADDYTPGAQQGLGNFLNSTPITWVRLGGGDDGYDPTTQIEYQAPASGSGRYVAVSQQLVNFTWFQAWCDSRAPHCLWMTYLPGEENNTQAAVHVAQYFHNVLHFVPTVWEFGNEPMAWVHYGLNRTTWSTTDNSTVTGPAYATMVHDYIAAVTRLFPSDKFQGIQNSCACDPSLLQPLVETDGSELTGLAYHNYPWLNGSSSNVAQFYGALDSSRSIPNTTAHMQAILQGACPACAALPVSIGEYQAGPVPDHSPFSANYTGAPFIAASVIQALESNVSTFTIFNIGWLFNTSNGNVPPQGLLYQRIFANMTMGTDIGVTVKAPGVGGVYALLVKNGTRESLLIVNTNSTRALKLGLTSAVFPVGLTGSYYTYSSYNRAPVAHRSLLLPLLFSVNAEEILLINNF